MNSRFTAEEEAFRTEVQQFLAANLSAAITRRVRDGADLTKAEMVDWHRILSRRGWVAGHWPPEWGGPGWSVMQRFIFAHESALAHAPPIASFGINMLGPVLIRYGSEEQKRRWLPRILNADDWWCQGYSEPNAGSDLASLKTAAVRVGDHYLVNGQKTWTTYAQHADMIFCLVRTDPAAARKQLGISFLLIDMKTPGVEVRPIRLLDGGFEVNEIFFTDVHVPAENLVGEENAGWTYAKYLLTYERTSIAGTGPSVTSLRRVKEAAEQKGPGGHRQIDHPLLAARLVRVETELANMETTSLRLLARIVADAGSGVEASMLKIKGTQIQQEIDALALAVSGPRGRIVRDDEPASAATPASTYLNNRKLSIYGGSNEVQRAIVAKAVLGL